MTVFCAKPPRLEKMGEASTCSSSMTGSTAPILRQRAPIGAPTVLNGWTPSPLAHRPPRGYYEEGTEVSIIAAIFRTSPSQLSKMSTRIRAGRANSMESKQARGKANACLRCYEKKIKCDMESLGQPCTGCTRDGVKCQKRSRKPYPPRREASSAASSTSSSSRGSPTRSKPGSTPPRSVPMERPQAPLFSPDQFHFSAPFLESPSYFTPIHDFSSNVMPHATMERSNTMTDTLPFFGGDEQDYAFLLSMCDASKDRKANALFGHKSSMGIMEPEALAYAEAKGCFSMPSHAVCEDLVQCYFHYVHPICPIMDIADFLEQYQGGALEGTSLLLLWSMFSVAANFASDSTLATHGYLSRAELKQTLHARAKCLYDLGYEQDPVTQIQSALLLGFWYSDMQDHVQSWHWTGIAISSAQSLGLHRDPDTLCLEHPVPSSRRRLLANIWWCCFFRDRWLSFEHGRPLRINADDCNVPMVSSDYLMQLPDRAPKSWHKYVSLELRHLGPIWIGLLQLTLVLDDILAANQSPRKTTLDIESMTSLERRIARCLPDKQARPFHSDVLLFFESHAQLHLEAAMIALYKPYASEFSSTSASTSADPTLIRLANGRVKDASARTSGILDRIISSDTLRFAGPMIIPLLVPSMTIHLLQAKSHDQFTSSWSRSRLDQCLLVLKRLEANYPAAALVHQLFAGKRGSQAAALDVGSHDASTASLMDDSKQRMSSSCGLDIARNHDMVHQWQGAPLDIHSTGSLCTPNRSAVAAAAATAQWSSPPNLEIVDPDFDLWNLTTPSEGPLFFPLDDVHMNGLEYGACAA